jgi:hypothetical protein
MAKFVNSIGAISGKVGNLVFTRNRYGEVLRRRGVPVNPKTMAQRLSRSQLGAASALWKTTIIPAGFGPTWNDFAANFPLHQGKGNKQAVLVTGQAFSVAINCLRSKMSLAPITSPPGTWGTDQPSSVTADIVTPTSVIISAIGGVTLDATDAVMVKATWTHSGGKSFIGKSAYKLIVIKQPPITLPIDITTDWVKVFGQIPPAGAYISLSVQVVKIKTDTTITGQQTACPGQPVYLTIKSHTTP